MNQAVVCLELTVAAAWPKLDAAKKGAGARSAPAFIHYQTKTNEPG